MANLELVGSSAPAITDLGGLMARPRLSISLANLKSQNGGTDLAAGDYVDLVVLQPRISVAEILVATNDGTLTGDGHKFEIAPPLTGKTAAVTTSNSESALFNAADVAGKKTKSVGGVIRRSDDGKSRILRLRFGAAPGSDAVLRVVIIVASE